MTNKITKGIILNPEFSEIAWKFFFDDKTTLENLYEIIGCHRVEVVQLTEELDLIVDEEGTFFVEDAINLGADVHFTVLYNSQSLFGKIVILRRSGCNWIEPTEDDFKAIKNLAKLRVIRFKKVRCKK